MSGKTSTAVSTALALLLVPRFLSGEALDGKDAEFPSPPHTPLLAKRESFSYSFKLFSPRQIRRDTSPDKDLYYPQSLGQGLERFHAPLSRAPKERDELPPPRLLVTAKSVPRSHRNRFSPSPRGGPFFPTPFPPSLFEPPFAGKDPGKLLTIYDFPQCCVPMPLSVGPSKISTILPRGSFLRLCPLPPFFATARIERQKVSPSKPIGCI